MGNLGGYQLMTTLAKRVGGPGRLLALAVAGGYVVIRPVEAGAKRAFQEIRKRGVAGPTNGQVFRAMSPGEDRDLKIRAGDEFRVLESDGDAILIELLGDANNPYFVSGAFLRSISDFRHGSDTAAE